MRAAMERLRAQGAHGMSMSALAEELGLKRTTLYWYFKDMHALFFALLFQLLTEQAEALDAHMAGVEHPVDRLYAHALGVDRFFEGRAELLLLLGQFWGSLGGGQPQEIIETSRAFFAPRRAEATRRLREGLDAGLVAPCDPDTVVRFVSALIDGLLIQRITHTDAPAPVHEFLWTQVLAPLKRTS